MKKLLISVFAVLFAAAALSAQTTEEILAKMNEQVKRFDQEGFSMVMDMKFPIIGTFSTTMYTLGDKFMAVLDDHGDVTYTWSDGITSWDYEVNKNELTIKNAQPSNGGGSLDALGNVTDGYDVKLKKETDEAWYFRCTKTKDNSRKDDPKKMDLVVSKATYLPISHSMSEKGVTVTLRDFALGVSEEKVTFNPDKYSTAKVIDER